MSKVRKADTVTERGSICGTTYLANPACSIITRSRVAPRQQRTAAQGRSRSAFSVGVSRWITLTEAQRRAWQAYGSSVIHQTPTGSRVLGGRGAYVAQIAYSQYINTHPNFSGTPIVLSDESPIDPGLPWLMQVGYVPLSSAGVGFELQSQWFYPRPMIYSAVRSRGYFGSRNYPANSFLEHTAIFGTVPGTSSLSLPFTGLVEGQVYFCRLRMMGTNSDDRRLTDPVIVRCIATLTT